LAYVTALCVSTWFGPASSITPVFHQYTIFKYQITTNFLVISHAMMPVMRATGSLSTSGLLGAGAACRHKGLAGASVW
jgi:hypothetical protein